jgi:hypothetical protein
MTDSTDDPVQEPDLSTIKGVPTTAWAPDLSDIKGANTTQHSITVDDPKTP